MKSLFCLLVSLFVTVTAQAQMGKTLEECTALYGEPVERKLASNVDEMVFFKKDDLKIGVGLKDNKCVLLILGNQSGEKLSEDQMAALLKEYSDGSLWKKSVKASGNIVWVREDNYAAGQYSPVSGILTLITTEYMKAEMARKAAMPAPSDGT